MDDIAKRLGVTKGTVSKALSGAEDVSDAMRKSVLETAVEMGYSRIPRSSDAPRLCVFIENMDYSHPTDFGWDLVTGFRKLAEPDGCIVDIVPLDIQTQLHTPYDEYILQHNYRGAFFLGIKLTDPWMQDLRTCRTPTVLLDNPAQYNPVVSHVGIDNDEGMELAIRALRHRGHSTIGYIGGGLESYIYQERYQAFFRALKKYHMHDQPELAGCSYNETECLQVHLPRLLELGCTAILCSHDMLAQTVLEHCQSRGIRVPEDVSIVGVDDLPLCQLTQPALSTIRQDRTELGKSAYYALSSQMSSVRISTLRLHPELILRESVGEAKNSQ